MNTSALTVSDVTKRFGSTVAVSGVSFEIGPHELVALVGPSGCGKSTLLRTIGGIHPVDSGRIELAGNVVDDGRRSLPPERRNVGLVFQDHALFPHLTVADNVGFGVRTGDQQARVDEMLHMVGLAGYERRFPHELSGGERQRVALARALAPRPALLLLDEPFASLDPNLRSRVRDDVVQILRSTSTPAVFVTHDQAEALAIGDRVAVMLSGRIVQMDTPDDVFHRPASRFVASFMGPADALSTVDAQRLVPDHASRLRGDEQLMLRPDDVAVEPIDERGAHAPNAAAVVSAEFRGSTWCYTLRLDSGTTIRAVAPHGERYDIGARVVPIVRAGHQPVRVRDTTTVGDT
jgi:iron(III) transport system ATP-binding protein